MWQVEALLHTIPWVKHKARQTRLHACCWGVKGSPWGGIPFGKRLQGAGANHVLMVICLGEGLSG